MTFNWYMYGQQILTATQEEHICSLKFFGTVSFNNRYCLFPQIYPLHICFKYFSFHWNKWWNLLLAQNHWRTLHFGVTYFGATRTCMSEAVIGLKVQKNAVGIVWQLKLLQNWTSFVVTISVYLENYTAQFCLMLIVHIVTFIQLLFTDRGIRTWGLNF